MKSILLAIVCTLGLIGLGGCSATNPTRPPADITLSDFVRTLSPQLVTRCSALPIPPKDAATSGDLYTLYAELQGQYNACAIKDDCLISAITGEPICHVTKTDTPVKK